MIRDWGYTGSGGGGRTRGLWKERSSGFVTLFYADDGLLASPRPARLQGSSVYLDRIFHRVQLRTNVKNTAGIVRQPRCMDEGQLGGGLRETDDGWVGPSFIQGTQMEADTMPRARGKHDDDRGRRSAHRRSQYGNRPGTPTNKRQHLYPTTGPPGSTGYVFI